MASNDLRSYGTNKFLGGDDNDQIGLYAYGRARSAGLSAVQISQLAQQQGVKFGRGLQGQIVNDITSDLAVGFNNKFESLNDSLNQQASAFSAAQSSYQNQISQQQAQQSQLQDQFSNLQNSRVPNAEKTAKENRQQGSTATPKKQSGLSSLAIVSGLGTQTNPLSGLQLA